MSGTAADILYDPSDEHIFKQYKWYITDNGYVVWRGKKEGKKQTVRLHRLIMSAQPGQIVDHINRNKLDNRRSNLRFVTAKENAQNGSGRWGQRVYIDLPQGITFDKSRNKYMTKKPTTKRFNTLEEAVIYRRTA
jgi:hypothetical protein